MTQSGIHLLLVDALNLIRRVYAAQPGEEGPQRAADGLRSSTHSLHRALRECSPTHAVCVFEGEGRGWRHHLFDRYKAGHAPMPEALETALPDYRVAFLEAGVRSLTVPRVEADDVVATLAVKVADHGGRATILSTDKAFLQLLAPAIRVRDHFRGRDLDEDYIRRKFGVEPGKLVDLLALAGDSTNGIPGVYGVGAKTAAKLLREHADLEAVLEAAPRIAGKLGDRLVDHADEARLARRLVQLHTDLELGVNLRTFRYRRGISGAGEP